jgi:hypothetical protein
MAEDKILLKVRTTEGSELDVILAKSGIVQDLRNKIMDSFELIDKNIRLIFSGKLLEPPNAPLNTFKLTNGSFVHAVITNKAQHALSTTRNTSGENGTSNSTNSSNNSNSNSNGINDNNRGGIDLSTLRGLEVLMLPGPRRATLTIDEVASLRSYFSQDIRAFAQQRHLQRLPQESASDFSYRSEHLWMLAQPAHSEFRANLFGRGASAAVLNSPLLSSPPPGPSSYSVAPQSQNSSVFGTRGPRLHRDAEDEEEEEDNDANESDNLVAMQGGGNDGYNALWRLFHPSSNSRSRSRGGRSRSAAAAAATGRPASAPRSSSSSSSSRQGVGAGAGTREEEAQQQDDVEDEEEEDGGEGDATRIPGARAQAYLYTFSSSSASPANTPATTTASAATAASYGYTDPNLGSWREFGFGFMAGFVLGFMMIFCIWDRNITHKQKLGILAGILMQLFFTALQQQQQQQHLGVTSGSGSGSSSDSNPAVGAGAGGVGIGGTPAHGPSNGSSSSGGGGLPAEVPVVGSGSFGNSLL